MDFGEKKISFFGREIVTYRVRGRKRKRERLCVCVRERERERETTHTLILKWQKSVSV